MPNKHNKTQLEDWAKENGFNIRGSGVKIKGKGDERSVAKGLQEFKRIVGREIAKELRGKEYYESKGTIRRRKKAEAIRRYAKMRREAANEV